MVCVCVRCVINSQAGTHRRTNIIRHQIFPQHASCVCQVDCPLPANAPVAASAKELNHQIERRSSHGGFQRLCRPETQRCQPTRQHGVACTDGFIVFVRFGPSCTARMQRHALKGAAGNVASRPCFTQVQTHAHAAISLEAGTLVPASRTPSKRKTFQPLVAPRTPLILPVLAQSWARSSQWPARSPHPTPSCSRRRRAPGLPLKSPCSQCGPKSWNQGSLGRRSRAGAAGSGAADHAAAPRTLPLSRLLQSPRRLSHSRPFHRGHVQKPLLSAGKRRSGRAGNGRGRVTAGPDAPRYRGTMVRARARAGVFVRILTRLLVRACMQRAAQRGRWGHARALKRPGRPRVACVLIALVASLSAAEAFAPTCK